MIGCDSRRLHWNTFKGYEGLQLPSDSLAIIIPKCFGIYTIDGKGFIEGNKNIIIPEEAEPLSINYNKLAVKPGEHTFELINVKEDAEITSWRFTVDGYECLYMPHYIEDKYTIIFKANAGHRYIIRQIESKHVPDNWPNDKPWPIEVINATTKEYILASITSTRLDFKPTSINKYLYDINPIFPESWRGDNAKVKAEGSKAEIIKLLSTYLRLNYYSIVKCDEVAGNLETNWLIVHADHWRRDVRRWYGKRQQKVKAHISNGHVIFSIYFKKYARDTEEYYATYSDQYEVLVSGFKAFLAEEEHK